MWCEASRWVVGSRCEKKASSNLARFCQIKSQCSIENLSKTLWYINRESRKVAFLVPSQERVDLWSCEVSAGRRV